VDGHALGEVVPSSLPLPSPVAVRSIASLMENVGGGEREAQNVTWEGFRQILAGRSGFGLRVGDLEREKRNGGDFSVWCSGWLARAPKVSF